MISAWAAILFAPTLVGSAYGMTFDGIPELRWRFGHAFAIVLMLAVAATLYVLFKRRNWIESRATVTTSGPRARRNPSGP